MNRIALVRCTAFSAALALAAATFVVGSSPAEESPSPSDRVDAIAAARQRAELLHETIHAVLEIVHQQYYREDEGLPIPAAALKSVFRELAERQHVELRWLVVDAEAMNVEHLPRTEFEKQAVRALASGRKAFESTDQGVYRRAQAITLTSECLKCHVPNRTNTKPRTAGLAVAIPL
jgi:hypothetical protein